MGANMKIIRIEANAPRQTMDGWGTSLCWWANAAGGFTMKGEDGQERREALMKLFFSEEGLDLNIVRYNIGGGDNPEEKQHMFHFRGLPCFRNTSESGFDKDADFRQLWVLKRAFELRKGDLIHEVFVNSPPWWMTRSLCTSGNVNAADDNLERTRYEEFAEYCAEVLAFLSEDIKVKADYFVPMNEAGSDYWAKGQRQEGNKVSPGENQSRLLMAAYEKLKEKGIEAAITGTDETNPTVALSSFRMLDTKVQDKVLKKINYHHYAEDEEALRQLSEIAYPDGYDQPRYKLWMDEVCFGDGEDDMELAKKLVFSIDNDLNIAHAGGWVIWQAMDTLSENIANHCHWGLIEGMYQDRNDNELEGILDVSNMGYELGEYVITTQYYVLGQYSRYIKPGSRILRNDGKEFHCVSAVSPDKKTLTAVLYNDENCSRTVMLELQGFAPLKASKVVTDNTRKWEFSELEGNLTCIELDPKSVTTLLFEREY